MNAVVAVAMLCLSLFATTADASPEYPIRPIQIVVPYGPGGVVDVVTRIVVDKMTQSLGQPVVVLNRPGGNANIGPSIVAQAEPDGYTLLASSSSTVINPLVEKNPGFGSDSFVPIVRIAESPNVLVVPASLKLATLNDFVVLAKSEPELATPVTGPGSSQAVARTMFARSANIQLLDVAYKGGVSFITDLLAGRLAMSVSPMNVVIGLVKQGRLTALAVTSERRSALLPDVPTMAEAGFAEATAVSWFGFHAPAGTPALALEKIAAAVRTATDDPEVRARIAGVGAEAAYLGTSAFESFLVVERIKAEKYVATINEATPR